MLRMVSINAGQQCREMTTVHSTTSSNERVVERQRWSGSQKSCIIGETGGLSAAETAKTPGQTKLVEELLDSKRLGQRGESFFVLQSVLMALVVFPPGGLKEIVDVVGWSILLLGLAIITAGSVSLGDNLTPLPKPRESGHSLVTDGMYKYVRHPMYGGVILGSLGLGMATGDETRLFLALLLFFALDKKASYEEGFLVEKYGNEYEEYRKKAKKLLPWIY
eukprot:jgi/Picsp_1/6695/NSC_04037-R1_isoprenylcysteine carboxyl methyltransferase